MLVRTINALPAGNVRGLDFRKRNGVYYTPEKIADFIIREIIGARLEDIKKDIGLDSARVLDASRLDEYAERLSALKIIDPSCGDGAFLVQALQFLLEERRWISRKRERITGQAEAFEQDEISREIIAKNIYGIDVDPESAKLTRLAVWLPIVRSGTPRADLECNIVCGNALVDHDFYTDFLPATNEQPATNAQPAADAQSATGTPAVGGPPETSERINAFDWTTAFPEVFAQGGFDCVIGNPPYVKLQNFRRTDALVAEYIVNHKVIKEPNMPPVPRYASTQTGNFDLYLPFIEKGLELLKPEGRMGYIAPSLWTVNDYGEGLRRLVLEQRCLERWVDFRDHQVFEEAITYTALQFYCRQPVKKIRLAFAPDGELGAVDWNRRGIDSIQYSELAGKKTWNFMPDAERKLFDKLTANCKRLD